MTLDTDAVIAIATGGSAAVVALLAIVIASMAKATSNRAERELQASQQAAARDASARWLLDRELEAAVRLQTRAIHAIQRLKDEVAQCAQAEAGRTDSDAAIQGISESGRRLASLYDEIHAQLGRLDRAALHRAKELGLQSLYHARTALEDAPDPAAMSEGHRLELLRVRGELGELQNALRDTRTEKLISRALRDGAAAAHDAAAAGER